MSPTSGHAASACEDAPPDRDDVMPSDRTDDVPGVSAPAAEEPDEPVPAADRVRPSAASPGRGSDWPGAGGRSPA